MFGRVGGEGIEVSTFYDSARMNFMRLGLVARVPGARICAYTYIFKDIFAKKTVSCIKIC